MRIGDIYPGFDSTGGMTLPKAQSAGAAAEANSAAAGKKSGNGLYVKIAIIALLGLLVGAKLFEK